MAELQKFKKTILFLSLLPAAFAGKSETLTYDFDLVVDSTGWMKSDNVSQLYRIPVVQQAGRAYVSYNSLNGKLVNYNVADKQYDISVAGEAYFRLSPETMLYSKASFVSENETDVVGSAFLSYYNRPFDLTFMDSDNKGDRKTERYSVMGALSHRLSEKFAIGFKLDYNAINMARMKDLRHTNKVLDLNFAGGVSYMPSEKIRFGLHYKYNRFVEGLKFNIYGTTDQQYMTLINFGAFSGRQELFDANGYTAKGENNPFVENIHSGGWQTEWQISKRLKLFNDLTYSSMDGYFGKKSSTSIVYTEHDGSTINENLSFIYTGNKTFQQLVLGFEKTAIDNYENSWRNETSASGNTVIEYYGQNLVGEKRFTRISGGYSLGWGNVNNAPEWNLTIGSSYTEREINSIIYPYYRTQKLDLYEHKVKISYQKNFGKVNLMISPGIKYRSGSGDKYIDGVYVTPSSDTGAPKYQDIFMDTEYDYLTSERVSPELILRFTMNKNSLGYFIEMKYENEFKISDLKENRNNIDLKIGVNF